MTAKQKWLQVYLSEEAISKLMAALGVAVFHPDDICAPEELNLMEGEKKERMVEARREVIENPPDVKALYKAHQETVSVALNELVLKYAGSTFEGAVTVHLKGRHMEILQWIASEQCKGDVEMATHAILRQSLLTLLPAWREHLNGESGTVTKEAYKQMKGT